MRHAPSIPALLSAFTGVVIVAAWRVPAGVAGPADGASAGPVCSHPLFDDAPEYAAGAAPSSLVVADFDGSLGADLAVANAGSDAVSIHLNQGDGTFAAATFNSPQ